MDLTSLESLPERTLFRYIFELNLELGLSVDLEFVDKSNDRHKHLLLTGAIKRTGAKNVYIKMELICRESSRAAF